MGDTIFKARLYIFCYQLIDDYGLKMHPLGAAIQPEEVAKSIAFLASDDARMITGINHVIDGGFLLAGAQPSLSFGQWDGPGPGQHFVARANELG